jgi:hypothetical protein
MNNRKVFPFRLHEPMQPFSDAEFHVPLNTNNPIFPSILWLDDVGVDTP